MRQLTIYRRYFYDSDCYNAARVQEQRGVQVHCTTKGASQLKRWVGPDDGRLGKNQYNNHHNRPGGDVCANAYIGKLADKTVACYQTLPWDYQCWLSGSYENGNANKLGYIGFEIASDNWDDEAYLREAVMGVSVNLTAYLCSMLGPLGTTPTTVLQEYEQGKALAVMDHKELRKVRLASNHGDITNWLSQFGLTMDDYRKAVEEAMEEGVEVTYVDVTTGIRPTIRKGDKGEDVRALQDMLNAFRQYGGLEVDGVYGRNTEASVRAFQGDNGLTPDGITGPLTWDKLEELLRNMTIEAPDMPQEPTGPIDPAIPGEVWEKMSLEEKVEDLNKRLKAVEGGVTNGS